MKAYVLDDKIFTERDDRITKIAQQIQLTINNTKTMQLSEAQYVDIYKAAMQALLSSVDAIILGPEEIAKRAREQADAMAAEYAKRGNTAVPQQAAQWASTSDSKVAYDNATTDDPLGLRPR